MTCRLDVVRLWSVMILVVGDTFVHSILRRSDVPQHFQSSTDPIPLIMRTEPSIF
jgi:hypothetical protein